MSKLKDNRQVQCLSWIVEYFVSHGYWPTFQEIADGVGFAGKSGARYVVGRLVARGLVNQSEESYRAITIPGLTPLLSSCAQAWMERELPYLFGEPHVRDNV